MESRHPGPFGLVVLFSGNPYRTSSTIRLDFLSLNTQAATRQRYLGGLFRPALAVMEADRTAVFTPRSFQGYLSEHGFSDKNTWQHISVDNLRRLAPELREAK